MLGKFWYIDHCELTDEINFAGSVWQHKGYIPMGGGSFLA